MPEARPHVLYCTTLLDRHLPVPYLYRSDFVYLYISYFSLIFLPFLLKNMLCYSLLNADWRLKATETAAHGTNKAQHGPLKLSLLSVWAESQGNNNLEWANRSIPLHLHLDLDLHPHGIRRTYDWRSKTEQKSLRRGKKRKAWMWRWRWSQSGTDKHDLLAPWSKHSKHGTYNKNDALIHYPEIELGLHCIALSDCRPTHIYTSISNTESNRQSDGSCFVSNEVINFNLQERKVCYPKL